MNTSVRKRMNVKKINILNGYELKAKKSRRIRAGSLKERIATTTNRLV